MPRPVLAAILAFLLGVSSASAQKLKVGDPAPSLGKVAWLRGEPVPTFLPGQVYVLDFWATWCGPCIMSIPHLIELQNTYADKNVNIIGVAVYPRPGAKPVRAFIAGRKDMIYRIAEDSRAGTAATNYLAASGAAGIPTAYVINQKGKIAWIGHPMDRMDEVIAKVVAGAYDPAEQQKEKLRRQQVMLKAQGLRQKLVAAQQAKDYDTVLDLSQQLVDLDPELFGTIGVYRYYILAVQLDDAARAAAYGQKLLTEILADTPSALNEFAWKIATNDGFPDDKRDLDLAFSAATRAQELFAGKDASTLDTLARIHFMKGDIDRAVEYEQQAIKIAPEGDYKDSMVDSLNEFRAAQTDPDDGP